LFHNRIRSYFSHANWCTRSLRWNVPQEPSPIAALP